MSSRRLTRLFARPLAFASPSAAIDRTAACVAEGRVAVEVIEDPTAWVKAGPPS